MSEPARHPFVAPLWLLIQAFWVGSLWGFHFVVLPSIVKLGFASLLVDDIRHAVVPALLGIAGCGVLLQMLLLVRVQGLSVLWRDSRGQLLLMALLFVLGFFVLALMRPEQQAGQFFCYLVVAVAGLMLFFQAVPGAALPAAAPRPEQ